MSNSSKMVASYWITIYIILMIQIINYVDTAPKRKRHGSSNVKSELFLGDVTDRDIQIALNEIYESFKDSKNFIVKDFAEILLKTKPAEIKSHINVEQLLEEGLSEVSKQSSSIDVGEALQDMLTRLKDSQNNLVLMSMSLLTKMRAENIRLKFEKKLTFGINGDHAQRKGLSSKKRKPPAPIIIADNKESKMDNKDSNPEIAAISMETKPSVQKKNCNKEEPRLVKSVIQLRQENDNEESSVKNL